MQRRSATGVIALAVAAGGISALLYLAVVAGGFGAVLLGYLAPLPLFLAGLSAGATAAALAAMIGAMLTAGLSGSDVAPLTFLGTAALPAVLVAAAALRSRTGDDGETRWSPPGDALMVLTATALGAFALAVVVAAGVDGGLEAVVRRALETVLAGLADMGGASLPADGPMLQDGGWLTSALPGFVAVSWMLMAVVNAVLAQGALTRFGRNLRPAMRFADLSAPRGVSVGFGAALAGAMLLPAPLGFWAVNVALILAVPLLFAGLAVAHAVAERRSAPAALLVAFYVFLFIFGWPIALMVGLGVIETWMGLSRRLRAGRPGQED